MLKIEIFLFPFNFEQSGEGCGGGLSLILKDTASEIILGGR